MEWKDVAIDDLRSLKRLRESKVNLAEEISSINTRLYSIKAITYDKEVVDGGDIYASEDIKTTNLVKREKLLYRLKHITEEVNLIEAALKKLNLEERTVLEYFYIDRPSRHIDKLMDLFHYEKSQIYNLKNMALHSYVGLRYGNINL